MGSVGMGGLGLKISNVSPRGSGLKKNGPKPTPWAGRPVGGSDFRAGLEQSS
jgi:hypothetical protein